MLCEGEIDEFLSQVKITILRAHLQEHLFMKDNLIGVINRNLVHNLHVIFQRRYTQFVIIIHECLASALVMNAHDSTVSEDVNVSLH